MTPLYKVFMAEGIGQKITEILYSGKIAFGANARAFEEAIKSYIGTPYVVTTSNNTYASIIALATLGIREGDEIIASPMACLASNQPALNFRAKLVWADIDPSRGTLDPESVRKKITSRTKAILHYHWCGYPGYVDEINSIGREYGVPVIDDCIEAFGSEYKGSKMGNVGTDVSVFSFQTVRLPNCLDGGAMTFKDPKKYEAALRMRDFGIDRSTFRNSWNEISETSDISLPGYNAMMNEINGFIGLTQVDMLPKLLEQQRRNAACWDRILGTYAPDILPLRPDPATKPNFWVYSAFNDKDSNVLNRFRTAGFYASRVHLRNDFYSCFGQFDKSLLGVNSFAKLQFSIPTGWWVSESDIEKISNI